MATGYALQDIPNTRQPQFGWPRNRVSGVIGVHTTENITDLDGSDQNAENCLNFLRTRGDHGSYHALADFDSVIPLVHPGWSTWADTTNNAHAMSVSGALQAARWRDLSQDRADQIVVNMAAAAANLSLTAVRDGYMDQPTPARRISAHEAVSGSRAGFYGHGETNPGTRYDPGAHFDWDLFLSSYSSFIAGGTVPLGAITTPSEDDELNADQNNALAEAWMNSKTALELARRTVQVVESIENAVKGNNGTVKKAADAILGDVDVSPYLKSKDNATVYALNVATGKLRPVKLPEWNTAAALGFTAKIVPQATIDNAPKESA